MAKTKRTLSESIFTYLKENTATAKQLNRKLRRHTLNTIRVTLNRMKKKGLVAAVGEIDGNALYSVF